MDLRFKHPFSAIICGPSSCGKTCFVESLVANKHTLFDTEFSKIVWCYAEWQPRYANICAEFNEGLPDMTKFTSMVPTLMIVDDLMHECNESISKLFTKWSHHRNISVLLVMQNIFHQKKGLRDVSLNAHYLVLFKNPRDKAQILYLSRQIFPENQKFLQEAFNDATKKAHGYLMIDLTQGMADDYRVRTGIFLHEDQYAYVPKN